MQEESADTPACERREYKENRCCARLTSILGFALVILFFALRLESSESSAWYIAAAQGIKVPPNFDAAEFLYVLGLFYCFLGVAVVSDVFMNAIERTGLGLHTRGFDSFICSAEFHALQDNVPEEEGQT